MKLVKWAVIALLGVVVLLAVIAALVPPTTYSTRVEVAAPVDVAWRVFTDEARMGEWLTGFRSIEPISGEPQTPGSRFRMTMEEDGREFVMEEEVLAWKDNEEYAFRMTNPMIEGEYVVRFEPIDEARTAIVAESETQGRGLFRLLVPLMKSEMVEREREIYARLGALIEAEPELYPDPEAGHAEPAGADS